MRKGFFLAGVVLLLAAAAFSTAGERGKGKGGGKNVELQGTLRTGIFAIGGETTGVTLTTAKGTYELDLGKDEGLRAHADKLDKKTVRVTGSLTVRKGVEVKERRIVRVTRLEEAKGKGTDK